MSKLPTEQTYIAALWEHPELCVALFGVQFHTEEGQRLYDESGIGDEISSSLREAEGFLLERPILTPEGPISLQYWRTHQDLDRYARRMPHGRWWKWLLHHVDQGLGFYHEIYQAKTAEAVYETGTHPVGPALFCSIIPVTGGEGRSKERLRRFAEAADSTAVTAEP